MIYSRLKLILVASLSLIVVALVLLLAVDNSESSDERKAFQALHSIAFAAKTPNGFWCGDVAELYIRGKISREIAEADVNPLKPLVDHPKPYHGYYFVAMESGPDIRTGHGTISLKGNLLSTDTFGFCAYPATPGRKKKLRIASPIADYEKVMDSGVPVLSWPNTNDRWSIID